MPINGVVESKLRFLEQTLADLESWPLGTQGEFAHNSMLRRAVERALQLAIESMIDVAERILAARRLPPADTAGQNLHRLKEIGVLKDAERYAEMVRFRNFIVHRYGRIGGTPCSIQDRNWQGVPGIRTHSQPASHDAATHTNGALFPLPGAGRLT